MSRTILELLTAENPVFRNYAFWSALLIIKVGLMAIVTGVFEYLASRKRARRDAITTEAADGNKLTDDDVDVERVRRAHHNDLENVVPLVLVMFLYTLTDPLPDVAVNLFRVVFAFRLWHTLVYAIYEIRQPARGIGWLVPYAIMMYMCVMVAITFVV